MNRQQKRKAARTPISADTLKRIVDDAVDNAKSAAFTLFLLALAKEDMDAGASREDVRNHLDKVGKLIDELQTNKEMRDEIIKSVYDEKKEE